MKINTDVCTREVVKNILNVKRAVVNLGVSNGNQVIGYWVKYTIMSWLYVRNWRRLSHWENMQVACTQIGFCIDINLVLLCMPMRSTHSFSTFALRKLIVLAYCKQLHSCACVTRPAFILYLPYYTEQNMMNYLLNHDDSICTSLTL